jgi:hypothetical protein
MTPFSRTRSRTRTAWLAAMLLSMSWAAAHAQSTGIIVESVNDYSRRNGPSLSNSIANGDGFMQSMLSIPSSPWHRNARWVDRSVYDTDFMDPAVTPSGADTFNFDIPGTAISYFTGHGFCNDGCSTHKACGSSASCAPRPTPRLASECPGPAASVPRMRPDASVAVVVRHFGPDGSELRLPQEERRVQIETPARQSPPPSPPSR